ncbi:hypothetical protein [Neolewinella antarctica]|uniref:Tetratricopeptide repeat protein n=1 Tax=Neolewinella antarctica TaxID=442734 RepID=A0ABX0XEI3_9BACT|nr:hypothetical protein [Neolewinella antarctica]NJC27730.1 hypothetical protein [Neolewinella antarctica]
MKQYFPFLCIATTLLVAFFAISAYRQAAPGARLYNQYFTANSPIGYTTDRALGLTALAGDAAILEQGKRYHQDTDYDLALVSLRTYLDHNPVPNDYLPELLAGTAAMATGNYAEARSHLWQLPESDSDADGAALWYLSLLDLREENLVAARGKLRLLAGSPAGRQYPVEEVLGELGLE